MPSFSTSNFVEGDTAVQPGGTVTALNASSTAVLAANTNRVAAIICNDGANVVYLSLGGTAALNSGIRLNAAGGTVVIDFYTGAINARAATADTALTITEV